MPGPVWSVRGRAAAHRQRASETPAPDGFSDARRTDRRWTCMARHRPLRYRGEDGSPRENHTGGDGAADADPVGGAIPAEIPQGDERTYRGCASDLQEWAEAEGENRRGRQRHEYEWRAEEFALNRYRDVD